MPEGKAHPTAQHVRFSLSAKILLWFCANLLVLALVAFAIARVQLRFGLDSLLAGRAGERVQSIAELIILQTQNQPRSQWNAALEHFTQNGQLRVALVENNGTLMAGSIPDLPEEVRSKLREGRPPERPHPGPNGQPDRPRPRPEGEPPPPRDEQGRPPRERQERPPHGPRAEDAEPRDPAGPRTQPPQIPPGNFQKFILRAGEPLEYWIGARIPVSAGPNRPPMPATLLVVVPSLGSGGLLFEFTPWVAGAIGVLVCSLLFWIPLVRGITGSLRQMNNAATRIAEGQFNTHLDTSRSDELGQLGASLNHMSVRLQEFVTGQKRFLGDIAHEIGSPLARMEMALAVLEQRGDERQRSYVEDVREEVRHMSNLLGELLSFTKAELRAVTLHPVLLTDLVERILHTEAPPPAVVTTQIAPDACAQADTDLLARALGNLVRNAVRYAGHAGPITVSATREKNILVLRVTDSGPGVPEPSLPRLFEPFYRPEAARTRETGGTGLGLAIVKSCVEACGGTVHARNRPGGGLEVSIVLQPGDPGSKA